ncbi:high nitrogen upregulated cytochrome P450 monooxygenase 2 [Coprinopsis marcescibilis]|uniref:High nitrogen upregulated cytochrome P450 monooxygenase 2 n=1 Tax=Coprinopsis marcescibilis TaxID=230819 RepID=A0A5C3L3V6_COPMA|nr:high nitrogen upregulated cytochrome P450 monooxygenase 2 [Coprinopsis marcescibilis]
MLLERDFTLCSQSTHYWFKQYEPRSPRSIYLVLTLIPILGLVFGQGAFSLSFGHILKGYATYYATLLLSVVLYRISPFHPLADRPGPFICKITKFWGAYIAFKGDTHRYYQQLHQRYGPIVRVGPNELSIVEKDAIAPVLGNQGMPRGPIWDGRRFGLLENQNWDSLIDCRNQEEHNKLRKPWNQAFSGGPIKDYQPILEERGQQLVNFLNDACVDGHGTLDIAKWISCFAFDFMGDLAFGGSFNLMRDGDIDGIWQMMEEGVILPNIVGQIPWAWVMIKPLPVIAAKRNDFTSWARTQAQLRLEMDTRKKDLFFHLYEAPARASGVPLESQMDLVVANSLLTIIAGSDTTSTTASAIICCLLGCREKFARLRAELDEAFPLTEADDGPPRIEMDILGRLPYLTGVVNEGLRLAPAVPSNIQRSPEDGSGGRLLIGTGIFIPEGTAVNIPAYSIQRDPRYFSPSPESFIPERWLPDPEGRFTTNKEAFIPFSHGPSNCAGKPMAMIELRFIIAMLVHRFDMCYKGFESASPEVLLKRQQAWFDGLKDRFVFSKDPLEVEVKPRWRAKPAA